MSICPDLQLQNWRGGHETAPSSLFQSDLGLDCGNTGRTEEEPNHLVPLMMRRGRRFPALVLVSLPSPARLELSPVELDLITATSPAVALGQDLASRLLALAPLASQLTGLRVLNTPTVKRILSSICWDNNSLRWSCPCWRCLEEKSAADRG